MRFGFVLALALAARLGGAQVASATGQPAGTTVRGTVRDSIANKPLAGAVVQLVGGDSLPRNARTTLSDALGRFAFDSVAAGRYMIGFLHPMLDSLGIESPPRELVVDGRGSAIVNLAIPSPARIRAAVCGPRVVAPSDAVVVGFVRDPRDGSPMANARVVGEWLEISIRPGAVERRVPRLVATAGENGWFALCNVPSPGTILVIASRGSDSTDVVELNVPVSGLLRRDLYPGASRTTSSVDAITAETRRVRAGEGRLTGVVVGANGRLLAGADVGIAGGPQTHTDQRGAWTLVAVPAGTRMLEVRALGYYPGREPVDVVPGAAPVRVELSTMQAVLDTVRINATRLTTRQLTEFDLRRRSGAGRFLTQADIERRRPAFTSDLFRSLAGVRFDRTSIGIDSIGAPGIMMRGAVADWCSPALYIDGHYMVGLTTEDLDSWVQPSEITGIEVYSGATAPPEFQPGRFGCGAIVIWTNLESQGTRPKLSKGQIVTALALVAFSVLPSLLLFRR